MTKNFIILIIFASQVTLGQPVRDFSFQGSWTVSQYFFTPIHAMTDKQAQEWVNKKATVKKVIHFPYYELPSYKNLFAESYCGFIETRDEYKDTIVSVSKYFESFKFNYKNLNLKGDKMRIVRTGCRDTPFQQILVKNKNEVLIFWDGTFFLLTRDKP